MRRNKDQTDETKLTEEKYEKKKERRMEKNKIFLQALYSSSPAMYISPSSSPTSCSLTTSPSSSYVFEDVIIPHHPNKNTLNFHTELSQKAKMINFLTESISHLFKKQQDIMSQCKPEYIVFEKEKLTDRIIVFLMKEHDALIDFQLKEEYMVKDENGLDNSEDVDVEEDCEHDVEEDDYAYEDEEEEEE
jgi:hypothetical protein